mmetsp:Transcript_10216/g.42859  ORF Transcript_10216/g.42859 Transcript_10216/m.42859 type:complete len:81 (-) Transcript_10216:805-1047(-)
METSAERPYLQSSGLISDDQHVEGFHSRFEGGRLVFTGSMCEEGGLDRLEIDKCLENASQIPLSRTVCSRSQAQSPQTSA